MRFVPLEGDATRPPPLTLTPAPVASAATGLRDVLAVLCIIAAYGVSLFVNGGGAPIPPLTALFFVGASRTIALLSLALALAAHAAYRDGIRVALLYRTPPLTVAQVLIPLATVLLANAGLVPYSILARGSPIIAPMCAVYVILPCIWGAYVLGERVSRRKFVGIVLSVFATLLLALAPGSVAPSTGSSTENSPLSAGTGVGLFLFIIFAWGVGDVGATVLGRGLPFCVTVCLAAVGQALTAVFAGLAATGDRGTDTDVASSALILCAANALGVAGWALFVFLGASGKEASTLAPIVSLYVFVPVILGVVLRGESVSGWGQWAGLLGAGAGGDRKSVV